MANHNLNVSVSIRECTDSTAHELRELTLEGLKAEEANKFLNKVTGDMAPHYHKLVVGYEQYVRDSEELAEVHKADPAKIAEETLKVLEGKMEGEVSFLKKEHDWEGKSMPDACYKALRSIISCLEQGGSLLEHTTVSQCKKFAAARKKEVKKAAADAHAAATGQDTAADPSVTEPMPSLGVDGPGAQEIAKLVAALADAYKMNPEYAASLCEATTRKAQSIVDTAKANLAERALAS